MTKGETMRRLVGVVVLVVAMVTVSSAPSGATVDSAAVVTSDIPIPKPGYAIARSVPYSQSVPAFPSSISGTSRLGSCRTTVRLFEGDRWSYIPEWRGPSANLCYEHVWAVRWRSANPDVTVRAGAYAVPDITIERAKPGGAGYISGTSCNAPEFKFGSAINGNESNLVDVYVEWRGWTVKPRI
jgi:hypothetical protein